MAKVEISTGLIARLHVVGTANKTEAAINLR
jgi:hypothetical protein